jgi:ATP-dependent DNA ligase
MERRVSGRRRVAGWAFEVKWDGFRGEVTQL